MKLYVNMRERKVNVLGPGTRYALWVSGCNKRCHGCINQKAQDMKSGDELETGAIALDIIASGTEGITISGGEPFLQAEALCEMLDKIKNHKDIGVIIYTGYLFEELESLPFGSELVKKADIIIDGPYIKELDDQCALRGSSNQRVIFLTDRYNEYLHLYEGKGRNTQKFNRPGEIHYVGIPTDSKYKNTI